MTIFFQPGPSQQIVGGEEATAHSFPWMAALFVDGKVFTFVFFFLVYFLCFLLFSLFLLVSFFFFFFWFVLVCFLCFLCFCLFPLFGLVFNRRQGSMLTARFLLFFSSSCWDCFSWNGFTFVYVFTLFSWFAMICHGWRRPLLKARFSLSILSSFLPHTLVKFCHFGSQKNSIKH